MLSLFESRKLQACRKKQQRHQSSPTTPEEGWEQKAGLDDKVKVFVLHVEPITVMRLVVTEGRCALIKSTYMDAQDGNQTAVVSNRKL
jgi:hypothetical protein